MTAFPKEVLQGLASEDYDPAEYEVIQCELIDNSRWSLIYEMIFKDLKSGKLYSTDFSRGATESQDESPYEYAGSMIECIEVEAVEVITIKYVAKSVLDLEKA